MYEINGQSAYHFKHYQVENGLSNNTVLCSQQDANGFMWFGTLDGLNRFDGYRFKTFRHQPQDSLSLGNNSIYSLYADKQGNVWVGTHKGLYAFNPDDETFTVVDDTKDRTIRAVIGDQQDHLWFIASSQLFSLNTVTNTTSVFLPEEEATSICVTDQGDIWVSMANGSLHRFNRQSKKFDEVSSGYFTTQKIEKIYVADKRSLIIGTLNGSIYLFDIQTGRYSDLLLKAGIKEGLFTRDFVSYSDNEIWAATERGIFIYNASDNSFTNLLRQYDNRYSLSDNAVNTLCRDREGGIWVGTRFGGIDYYPFPYISFSKYFAQTAANSISGNSVHEIRPDNDGNIWIGTEDAGLNKLNLATQTFQQYLPGRNTSAISSSNVHGLLVDGDDIWIGTFQYGIDRMNRKSGKVISKYTSKTHSLTDNFIVHLFKSNSSTIYVGTWGGLLQYDRKKDDFDTVAGLQVQTQSIIEDDRGHLWICTLGNGVYEYDPRTHKIINLRHDPLNANSLSSNMVNGLYMDSRGVLWFATESGLCKYDRASNAFKRYTTAQGLPSNFLFKILEDSNRNLWISSTRGLTVFNPVSESMKVFTTADGLLSNQFNWNSAYKDKDGRMYFGSSKGMISFTPEKFSLNRITPPVYITGIQIHDKEISIRKKNSPIDKAIPFTDRITLPYDESSISIDFAALSFTSPEMNEYAYKMDGMDDEWTYLKANRKAYFTQLEPGTYTFRLKASNGSGVWNEQETKLLIKVLPPFWASNAARLLYIFLALTVIFFTVRGYHNRTAEKNRRKIELMEHEKEKELYQAKIEFFTNVAHEIRTPLALIKGPMEKVMARSHEIPDLKNSLKIMERNTNRLIDLTNQLLDFRQTETKGFRLSFVRAEITALVEEIHAGFIPIAEQKKIVYSFSHPGKQIPAFIDLDAVNKILCNLYSNAFKYASGKVEVKLIHQANNPFFVVEVRNDGFLVPYELREKLFEPFFRLKETKMLKGTGIGLALSRSLAELHKGTLELAHPENNMNVFRLTMPLNLDKEPPADPQVVVLDKASII